MGPAPARRTRRRAAWLLAAAALAGTATVAAGGTGLPGGGGRADDAPPLPAATAEVTRETLRDTRDADGELGYGPAVTAVSRRPGTVTWLPESGALIGRGKPLYRIDDDPVVLMYGATPAYRDLRAGTEGRDVEALERNLRALGYDGFTVDGEYTSATAAAVMEWQQDRGLEETGVVELGRVVFAAGRVRVDALETEAGRPTGPGQRVLTYTGTAKAVTVRLAAEDRRMAREGAGVTVTLPDGRSVDGEVAEVSTVIEPGQGQDAEPETALEVVVSLGQKAVRGLEHAAVDVTFTASRRKDVLTVPVAALVALREGGFGVEVVEGGRSRHVAVETGMFAGGRVEVSGGGLTEGTIVGMPE
ncbi:peptidoglycan-binding protein [Planomonospora alba]|uniref:Peptidoglycan-binding protein n=1 Tax=Planomonospora alba TaxID=161354 RepID=A0ABP6MYR8_9ACTN